MPSENVATSGTARSNDRRARKREARRDHLLDLAADIVDADGVDGLTMAALADLADYATASLYTYFPSRSALVAALQERALAVLGQVAEEASLAWERAVAQDQEGDVHDPQVVALARLCAFSDLFLVAPRRHRREFRLQQELLATPGVEEAADAGSVVPMAMHVLGMPQRLLHAASEAGALHTDDAVVDLAGIPLDPALARTFAWVLALNGALLADGLVTGLPTTGAQLGTQLTDALLVGWGADARQLRSARALSGPWLDLTEPSKEA